MKKSPKKASASPLSYTTAGVNIDVADETKKSMAKNLETTDARVLNTIGAFASLFDASFPDYKHPVLVTKTEEPGTKQLLAFEHGRVESICQDMVHHLINDVAVMGAIPLTVQDCIVCGKLEKEIVTRIVAGIADACKAQGCSLTGGETSEQPGMLAPGRYVLTSSVIGIVEKEQIIDGSKIQKGDVVLALESSGVHTNGLSLVRKLMEQRPEILKETIEGRSFLDVTLTPHRCYFQALKGLFDLKELHGLAHITGGGIQGNLNRILPKGTAARIDLHQIRILPIFRMIKKWGDVPDADMLKTFNMGIGMTAVVAANSVEVIREHLAKHGCESYPIGEIVSGTGDVVFEGSLQW